MTTHIKLCYVSFICLIYYVCLYMFILFRWDRDAKMPYGGCYLMFNSLDMYRKVNGPVGDGRYARIACVVMYFCFINTHYIITIIFIWICFIKSAVLLYLGKCAIHEIQLILNACFMCMNIALKGILKWV